MDGSAFAARPAILSQLRSIPGGAGDGGPLAQGQGGRGWTAVFYQARHGGCFAGESLHEIQEITFEIGTLEKYGLDINVPKETHILRALPGRTFSVLELLCIKNLHLACNKFPTIR